MSDLPEGWEYEPDAPPFVASKLDEDGHKNVVTAQSYEQLVKELESINEAEKDA